MDNLASIALCEAWRDRKAREFFLNTWPLYVHELRGFGADFYTLDATGQWQPRIAPDWVANVTPNLNLRAPAPAHDPSQPFQRTHVISRDGWPIGFACVGLRPFKYMPDDCDYGLAEFFLVHGQRGGGLGERAVDAVLRAYPPGSWHLRVLAGNTRALRFWAKTLPALAVHALDERREAGDIAFRFTSPGA